MFSYILESLVFSFWFTLWAGIPVIIATTSATFSSVTISLLSTQYCSHFSFSIFKDFSNCFSVSLNLAASSYFCCLITRFFFSLISVSLVSSWVIASGTTMFEIWTLAPASSKASIALSGKCLSDIYLTVKSTQAAIASGV